MTSRTSTQTRSVADLESTPPRSVVRGLYLDVLRSAHRASSPHACDTTAGGVTSRCDRLVLVGTFAETARCETDPKDNHFIESLPTDARVVVPHEAAAPVALRSRRLGRDIILDLVPVTWSVAKGAYAIEGYYTAGGNYAVTSDSRASQAARSLGVSGFYGAFAVHDRFEWGF